MTEDDGLRRVGDIRELANTEMEPGHVIAASENCHPTLLSIGIPLVSDMVALDLS
jgi:hypothetical protein